MKPSWEVEITEEFGAWFSSLREADQDAVADKVHLLAMVGPQLGRPHADSVKGSRHSNMKELRIKRKQMRVLFAFDPRRAAILLIGGAKHGDRRFYERMIPIADALFGRHLGGLRDD